MLSVGKVALMLIDIDCPRIEPHENRHIIFQILNDPVDIGSIFKRFAQMVPLIRLNPQIHWFSRSRARTRHCRERPDICVIRTSSFLVASP